MSTCTTLPRLVLSSSRTGAGTAASSDQGLTLVHFSAQDKPFLWDTWVVAVGFGDRNGSGWTKK